MEIQMSDIPYLKAALNDKRLTKRFNRLLRDLSSDLSASLPQAVQSKGATKAAYRFFDNKKVQASALISAHAEHFALASPAADRLRFLVLSDSCELDYSTKKGAEHLGPLTRRSRRGMILHSSLLISDIGLPVGILRQDYIIRSDEDFGQSPSRKYLPIEQKESVKWLDHFRTAQALCEQQAVEIVYVADREADIIEVFQARQHQNMHFVVRSQFNRCVVNSELKLYQCLEQQALAGTYTFDLIDAQTGKIRQATMAVRFCQLNIKLSDNTKSKHKIHLPSTPLTALEAYEIDPPQGADPIRWVLLTSLPVADFLAALQIIQYYVMRWLIERFHFLLKSGGANIEHLQLQTPHRLKNAIATYSIAAMNAMKMRYIAENEPNKSVLEIGITPLECDILYTYVQHKIDAKVAFDEQHPPTVWEFCRTLGRIGGFIPSKRQPLPGLKILTRAIQKYNILLDAHDAFLSKN